MYVRTCISTCAGATVRIVGGNVEKSGRSSPLCKMVEEIWRPGTKTWEQEKMKDRKHADRRTDTAEILRRWSGRKQITHKAMKEKATQVRYEIGRDTPGCARKIETPDYETETYEAGNQVGNSDTPGWELTHQVRNWHTRSETEACQEEVDTV